jgi:hypothetical protein
MMDGNTIQTLVIGSTIVIGFIVCWIVDFLQSRKGGA